MFLYGASGHAKVIIDILRAGHESIEALFDDNVEVTSLLGHPVLRPSEVRGPLIVSIGNNRIRKRIVDTLSVEFGCAIHPLSIVSELADIGEGSVVMQGSIIQVCAQAGIVLLIRVPLWIMNVSLRIMCIFLHIPLSVEMYWWGRVAGLAPVLPLFPV